MADSAAMLTRREASTPRLRLGVLASLLVNIALKLHSEESKYTSASPRCTCFPPRATSTQVRLVQVQVQLGFASLDLNLDSAYLRGVSGGHLVQLQLKSPSSSPSSTRLRLVELGLGLGGLEWSQRWFTSCNFSQAHLLIGVCGGSPRATPLKFNFCNLKFNFST